MEKLKQLCFLTLLTMLFASCSRIVSTDYEVMEHGTITAADSLNRSLSVCPLTTGATETWYVGNHPLFDALSLRVLGYTKRVNIGDTVYVYRDGGKIFISKCSIADAKDINEFLCSFYWQNIAQNWYWFLLIFGIIALCLIAEKEVASLFALVIGFAVTLGLTGLANRLQPMFEGTITEISADFVKLDSARIVPYASLEDIKTRKPVKVGQNVTLYSAEYLTGRKIFFSSQKLNREAVTAPQSYPEVWLKSTLFFFVGVLLMQIPFYCIQEELNKRKRQSKN